MNTQTNAINNPVRRSAPQIDTGNLPVGQPQRIVMPDEGLPDREDLALAPPIDSPRQLNNYMTDIMFNEEPITIRLERSPEKFAPRVVDCWVNGKGAEQLIGGKWVTKGWLPVGIPTITKRKYVEVLLRAKRDLVQTAVVKHEDREDNIIDRYTSSASPLSIVRDDNPAGADWVQKILMEA